MTTFLVSLFLPYTINFETTPERPPSPEIVRPRTVPEKKLSLLAQTPGKIVQTPGATTDHERIFTPSVHNVVKLSLPIVGKVLQQETDKHDHPLRTATAPGSLLRNPRLLARADLHSPAWGSTTSLLNQPVSRAKSPPPASVLKHGAKITHPPLPWRNRMKTRTVSHEKQFNENNFSVERAQHGNGGLFNAIDAVSESGLLQDKTWVGTLGMPTDALDEHLKQTISECLENDFESLTIFVDDGDFDGHYERYCKTILWPIFHYQIPDSPKSKAYEDHSYGYYRKINEVFATRILKNYKKGDTIWIHDYHLLLLPGMLREKLPDAQIGLFMHTAFPSSEIFRCLAMRMDLLQGLLGANMVGFQNEEYSHHFLQTCSRLLPAEATPDGILLEDGRFVHVINLPMGIDPKGFEQRRAVPEVNEWVQKLAEKFHGKRIMVARDQLDSIRGVRQKLLAYERFLNRCPEYREDVVLIQIATSSPNEDLALSSSIGDIVTRINSTHATLSHQPLVYLRQDIDHSQYLALCTVAEVFIVTSLREGMNLTSHEYVCCQDGKYSNNKHNALILSEFTGSANVLGNNALLVNPWHFQQVAESIKEALDMPVEKRRARWEAMYTTVTGQNASCWYSAFMRALEHAHAEHSTRDATAVPRLSQPNLKVQYDGAGRRLLILDYEGTLASWGSPSQTLLTTPQRAIEALKALVEDSKNIIYVMSGRKPEELERLFTLTPDVGLIAENGNFVREPGTNEWLELFDRKHVDTWKPGVRKTLQYYVDRIEGSKIEERHSGLILDYSRNDENSNGAKLAGECVNHLSDSCKGHDIQPIPIENGLCISGNVNKGTACQFISNNIAQVAQKGGKPLLDFLLVIGDSREDEYAFSWAKDLENAGIVKSVCTVTIGTRNTGASATLTQGVTGKQ